MKKTETSCLDTHGAFPKPGSGFGRKIQLFAGYLRIFQARRAVSVTRCGYYFYNEGLPPKL
jgi:hypothetical protein